jgi:hypothetical protein
VTIQLSCLVYCCVVVPQVGHRRDQYKRCAHLLEAVSQLLEHFSHYQDVPKIQSLTKRLSTVQVGPICCSVQGCLWKLLELLSCAVQAGVGRCIHHAC